MTLLASRHAPVASIIPLLHRHLQPALDQGQHVAVTDAACNRLHQRGVRNRIEVLAQIGIHDIGIPIAQRLVNFPHGVLSRTPRTVAVSAVVEVRLEDRFQNQLGRGLHHTVPSRRDPEGAFAAARLGDSSPSSPRCHPGRHRVRDDTRSVDPVVAISPEIGGRCYTGGVVVRPRVAGHDQARGLPVTMSFREKGGLAEEWGPRPASNRERSVDRRNSERSASILGCDSSPVNGLPSTGAVS